MFDAFANSGAGSWSVVTNSGAPSARAYHSSAYMNAALLFIIFGGFDGTSALGDGKLFDGTSWSNLTSSGAPAARYNAVSEWSGSTFFIWGGQSNATTAIDSGGRYVP
jgi:hypothetical protein